MAAQPPHPARPPQTDSSLPVMLLTITTTCSPATDLGWLLHKHPDRAQTFDLTFGRVHICYPIATDDCCTVVLLLDVDPVGLVRWHSGRTENAATLGKGLA